MLREILEALRKDNLLKQAFSRCYSMLDLCGPMVRTAIDSLRKQDTSLQSVDVDALTRQLEEFESKVRRKVMTHLALGNVGSTGTGLSLISVVLDIERIGDNSQNIVDLARLHPTRLDVGPHEADLARLEAVTLDLLDRAVTAFKDEDAEAARAVRADYKREVFEIWNRLEADLVSGKTQLSGGDAATLALYARFLKRIAAHTRNLAGTILHPIHELPDDD